MTHRGSAMDRDSGGADRRGGTVPAPLCPRPGGEGPHLHGGTPVRSFTPTRQGAREAPSGVPVPELPNDANLKVYAATDPERLHDLALAASSTHDVGRPAGTRPGRSTAHGGACVRQHIARGHLIASTRGR